MKKIPSDMVTGSRHTTNQFGELEVVEYTNTSKVRVRFVNTGYETVVQADSIRRGKVKDKLVPSVLGVGYVGDGAFKPKIEGRDTKIYKTWKSMLERCYDKELNIKRPTYVGCSVVPEWHNFQNFAQWMNEQDYQGKQLDKDIKVKGNKVYGPTTCNFVTPADNAVEANAKHFTFTSPDGERVEVYNLNEFCRKSGLLQGCMSQVHSGKRKQHKGWTAL